MRPELASGKAFARAGRLAKRFRDVQQEKGIFRIPRCGKTADAGGFPQ
jgi:hypothetical protein